MTPRSVEDRRIGELVAQRASEILEQYERGLVDAGSRLMLDPQMREGCLAQARGVLAEVELRLSGADHSRTLALSWTEESRQIGTTRARADVHPSESLRAVEHLFDAIIGVAASASAVGQASPTDMASLARTTMSVMASRLRMAAGGYIGSLLDVLEEHAADERNRVSRDLHDHVGSALAGLMHQLELVRVRVPGADAAMSPTINQLSVYLDDLRSLIADLQAWRLENPLEQSLRTYLAEVCVARPVESSVEVSGDEAHLGEVARSELFVILREAVRNAIEHGGPSTLTLRVNISPVEAYGVLADDGSGFDRAAVSRGGASRGLSSMAERAQALGGEVVVTSEPGLGCRVEVLIPATCDEGGH